MYSEDAILGFVSIDRLESNVTIVKLRYEAGYLKRFLRGEVMEYFSVFGAPFEHASLDSNDQGLIF